MSGEPSRTRLVDADHLAWAGVGAHGSATVHGRRLNDKIRIKLTDRCNMTCPFCHAEGGAGASDIDADDPTLWDLLGRLRDFFGRVHLTGGEPTMYPRLGEFASRLTELGYRVALTTNGMFPRRRIEQALPYLDYANISLHSLRPEYVDNLLQKSGRGAAAIQAIRRNVEWLAQRLTVNVNTVITASDNAPDIDEILAFTNRCGVRLKLVPDYRCAESSAAAIASWLDSRGFEESSSVAIWPGSNVRRYYKLGDTTVEWKTIERWAPPIHCGGCALVHTCVEGFSFVRIEGRPARVRLCLGRPPIGPAELSASLLDELGFRK